MKIVRVDDSYFIDLWKLLFQESEVQDPLYQPSSSKFYDAFWSETVFVDCSFLIEEKGRPAVGLRVTHGDSVARPKSLSFFGMPMLYIENHKLPYSQIRGARKALKVEWNNIFHAYLPNFLSYRDIVEDGFLSFFGQLLLNMGSMAELYLTQAIDLSRPVPQLHGEIRKSYKSLINWGKRNLVLRLLNSETVEPEDIERFRLLHFNASGRATRSRETWDVQYEMILHKEAFAVFGELNNELVSASLFPYSQKCCTYGVSASNRDLFDKPLSHVIMWESMQYAKELGCRFFELGPQYYPKQHPEITEKEFGISTFKHGFGGRTHVFLDIVWERSGKLRK